MKRALLNELQFVAPKFYKKAKSVGIYGFIITSRNDIDFGVIPMRSVIL